ncbi:uncharacterized protein TRUGW13939_09997 [Talaromyces rugulosus]|uniref:Retrovirus-related Pol polyprotein from transposon TNT 1-94-like beta-barrel domain-containing protein n=1 Tax=Talaromyces rugulosus TaxID=121627 RepID=A0A7H8R915_TALRU|nr:uncharacterized protein TRUGW13939_09997 [Talaromyces rugulosus]QKX62832.1 hypothetical protein TRUGW13939_09997 [Talaromyces rugulosus]
MGDIGEHWKDVKEQRKKRKQKKRQKRQKNQSPSQSIQPPRRCWDWMVVSGSCHYARNRASFKEYRHIGRTVSHTGIPGETFVTGVGTVELKVRSSSEEGSPTRTLVLDDVLHIPKAICNGFCFAKYHTIIGGSTSLGSMSSRDNEGQPLWYSEDFHGLKRLVLDGNPQGESYLDDGPKLLSMHVDTEQLESILSQV